MAKYLNKKVVVNGEKFDSKKEAFRYSQLALLAEAGEIYELKRQVPFVLIPKQKDEHGKVLERECRYIADFTYRRTENGRIVVEDVKSRATKTPVYKLKKKLMLYRHGIQIQEV